MITILHNLKRGDELKLSETIFQVSIEIEKKIATTWKPEPIENQKKFILVYHLVSRQPLLGDDVYHEHLGEEGQGKRVDED